MNYQDKEILIPAQKELILKIDVENNIVKSFIILKMFPEIQYRANFKENPRLNQKCLKKNLKHDKNSWAWTKIPDSLLGIEPLFECNNIINISH